MPKVSVLLSVYNCKNFKLLKESVNSIINQTFDDWEMLIYNDGSTDNGQTASFIKELEKLDTRIRIIDNPVNHGLAYAKNQLIKLSQGNYITAQDDDDLSKPDRLEKEVKFLDSHLEYDFVGTLSTIFDEKYGEYGHYKLVEQPSKDDFLWNSPFHHPTVMFRRNALSSVNGYRVSKETMRAEDYDLFMRLYATGHKGYNIQEELYEYRMERNPEKKYRPMKDRWQEAKVRWEGFKKLGILGKGVPYIIKPILIGLMPTKLFYLIKNK